MINNFFFKMNIKKKQMDKDNYLIRLKSIKGKRFSITEDLL